ncbi:MAG TPA: YdcF family protein [Methylomirabilota bacterium]|nr:YdcF family protein [Methylomirabilota bacterium]
MESSEYIPQRKNSLIVFGQGPVVDSETKIKAIDNKTEKGKETVHFWGKGLVDAAAILHKNNTVGKIIVLGGKTGGEVYDSEAELVAKGLTEQGISQSEIAQETRSTNTLENLVNVCNDFLDKPGEAEQAVDILGAPYHMTRMKLLMKLFAIPYNNVFASDEVVRAAARGDKKADEWDHKELSEIERRLDINAAGRLPVSDADKMIPGYYDAKEGEERKTILRRVQEEEVWMRAMMEIPEYSLKYFAQIKNDKKLGEILENVEELFPGELVKQGIIPSDTYDTIREKLAKIERKMPDRERWIEEHAKTGLSDALQEKIMIFIRK